MTTRRAKVEAARNVIRAAFTDAHRDVSPAVLDSEHPVTAVIGILAELERAVYSELDKFLEPHEPPSIY